MTGGRSCSPAPCDLPPAPSINYLLFKSRFPHTSPRTSCDDLDTALRRAFQRETLRPEIVGSRVSRQVNTKSCFSSLHDTRRSHPA